MHPGNSYRESGLREQDQKEMTDAKPVTCMRRIIKSITI